MQIAIKRHNGQNSYGEWLERGESDLHGDIPEYVYDAAEDEACESDTAMGGHFEVGGQHWDWSLA